jgi:hypothetical protein
MNFAQVKAFRASKTFDYEYTGPDGEKVKEPVTISFPESCLTADFFDAVRLLQEEGQIKPVARELANIDLEWDLMWQEEGEDEKPFPPTYENLSSVVDINFLLALAGEMTSSLSGNASKPSKSRNSLAGSAKSRTAKAG